MQSKEGRTKLLFKAKIKTNELSLHIMLGLWIAMVLNVETTAPPLWDNTLIFTNTITSVDVNDLRSFCQAKKAVVKERPEWDSHPDIFNNNAVLYQLGPGSW